MNKNNLKKYFLTDNKSGYKTRKSYIEKNHPELFKNILNYSTVNNKKNYHFTQQLYDYLYDIIEQPKCLNCGSDIKWRNVFSEGYKKYCNKKCSSNSTLVRDKMKETNFKKYGVEYISQNSKIQDKIVNSNIKKYGMKYSFQSDIIKSKIKNTMIQKYGVEHPMKSEELKKKRNDNNIKKYGVSTPSKLDYVINKMKETNFKKYGVNFVMESDLIKEKLLNKKLKELIIKNKLKDFTIENIDNSLYKIVGECSNHEFYLIDKNLYYHRLKYGVDQRCILCNPPSKTSSIKENEVKNFIVNDLKINIIENDRKILNGKELDIFLSDHKIGIEFNGLYWHSNKYLDGNYHLNKTELANSKGIQLLQIFEDEWIYKSEIVKSIIRNKLNLIENKIYGRKCEIVEISSRECKDFLNMNHIQGNINSSIRIALKYDNKIVSVMTFGKKRISLGSNSEEGHYEMYRFCNKLNTNIIGGASKLFKYFLKNYNPKEIISYADRRYFDGKLYENLDFIFVASTKPNYWYFKEHTLNREYRYKYRKNILILESHEKTLTEKEIMSNKGFLWIYDSGNLKFRYSQ